MPEINEALQKTYDIALKLQKASKNLNGLILAGGSTKLPCIKKFLSKHFDIIECDQVDKMVSLGAACFANFQDQLLIDIAPFNLGIETANDEMEIFIPNNTPLPYISKRFFKKIPGHSLLINILQGFSNRASECVSLAKFEIQSDCDGDFSITFILDYDAILTLKLQLPGQDEQILTVSDKIYLSEENYKDQLISMLAKISHLNLNDSQKKIYDFIKQASETGCNADAFNWLKNEFTKEFN
jgi:molecular chaperone DnaK (HSP70)